jgi:hypothetical protein
MVAVSLWFGCSHTRQVLMPPRVVLEPLAPIGVIPFTTNQPGSLGGHATQRVIEFAQSGQPGVRFLELGNDPTLGATPGLLSAAAVREIGRQHGVKALLLGHLEISEAKPAVQLTATVPAVRAQVYVEGVLGLKLLETEGGSTVWTRMSKGRASVARVGVSSAGPVHVGISDPEDRYGELVDQLTYTGTEDFRPYFVRQQVED